MKLEQIEAMQEQFRECNGCDKSSYHILLMLMAKLDIVSFINSKVDEMGE